MRFITLLATILLYVTSAPALAQQCSGTGSPITGGGDETQDCHLQFSSDRMYLNFPICKPDKPKPGKEVRCFDGDAGCDLDGETNGECVFEINACLFNNEPTLPSCTPATINAGGIEVAKATKVPELLSLQNALDALLPASSNACTSSQVLTVPLKGPNNKGEFKRGKGKVKIKTSTAGGGFDKDKLKLACVPRNWPAEGYNHSNTRSNDEETKITAANAATLEQKWERAVTENPLPGFALTSGVSSAITVNEKLAFATTWAGKVIAFKKKDGKTKWVYDSLSVGTLTDDKGIFRGIQTSANLTADGRLLVGDRNATVHCLDAKRGKLLWQASIGDPSTASDAAHVWSSPQIVNGRVFVGRGSHDDDPCTHGRVFAFDLNDGAMLWETPTIPDKVCIDDTSVVCTDDSDCGVVARCLSDVCDNDYETPCTMDGDCPAGGTCVMTSFCEHEEGKSCTVDSDCDACILARGGAVTGTIAVDSSGDTIYAASVGCLSFPTVQDADSIYSIDAATGAKNWTFNSSSIEQFQEGIDYHDYGFLNGPSLVEVDDGLGGTAELVVAGGKDGTLYALDRATGALVWSNEVVPAPPFAAFGLFNAGIAIDDGRVFAALSDFPAWPAGNDNMYAFDIEGVPDIFSGGGVAWTDPMADGFAHVGVGNGIVYSGSGAFAAVPSDLYMYEGSSGTPLGTLTIPGSVTGGPTIVNGQVYVGYGLGFGDAGVIAFGLPELP